MARSIREADTLTGGNVPMPMAGAKDKRGSCRRIIALPIRLTWKDRRGTTRFVSAVTRDISDLGMFCECVSPVSLPDFHLVHVQFERIGLDADLLPASLRQGRAVSFVHRVANPRAGERQGVALRLLVDPARRVAVTESRRATA